MSRVRIPRAIAVLVLIAVAALAFRVGYIAVAKLDEPRLGDAIYYNAQAISLAEGRGFEVNGEATAEHPPLTALYLAPVTWLWRQVDAGADAVLVQRLAIAVVGAAVVFAIGLVGRRVGGDRVGYVAAVIAALNPNLWVNDALIMSEALATLAVAIAILLAYRLGRDPNWANAAWLGVACGLAALVRSELLLLVPLMVVPTIWFARAESVQQRLRLMVVSLAATVVAVTPWIVPNLVRFDKPVLFSTNDGLTLCGANLDPVYYGSGTGLWALDCAFLERPPGDKSVQSNHLRHRAVEYVEDHLTRVPVVVAARVARVWSAWDPAAMARYNEDEGREYVVSWLGVIAFWVMAPFAVWGAVLLRRRRVALTPLLAQVVMVTLTAALVYGLIRFRVPAEITLVVLTAVAIDQLLPVAGRSQKAGGATPEPVPAVTRGDA